MKNRATHFTFFLNMERIDFENEYVKFVIEEGILTGSFKCELVDLNLAEKITGYRAELQYGISYPILSDITLVKNSTKGARDYLASELGCEGVIAAAILSDSPIGNMIANFFINVSKPLRPTKIFTKEADAKKWLAQYVKKD